MIQLDTAEARGWLDQLYEHSGGGLLHVCAAGDWNGCVFTTDRAGLDAAMDYITAADRAGREGVYARVTTLREAPPAGARGGADLAFALPALWADLDIAGPGHADPPGDLPLPPDEEAARLIVTTSGLPEPTVWQHSGGGLYPWWLLDPAHVINGDLASVQTVSRRWQNILGRAAARLGWHYGTGVYDLARVLRIPGTVNRKAGLERPSRLLDGSAQTFTLDELYAAAGRIPDEPPPPVRPPTGPGGELRPGDDFNTRATWDEILTPHGWAQMPNRTGAVTHWTRPGKTRGTSATTGYGDRGGDYLYVFSTEAGLNVGQPYDKFGAYAALNHRGDLAAAARDLGSRGYGERRQAAPSQGEEAAKTASPRRRKDAELSDACLAQEIADNVLSGRYCWTAGLGWMTWTGQRWRRCEEAAVVEMVRQYLLDKFHSEVEAGCDGSRRAALYSLLGKARIGAVTTLARGIVLEDAAEFDQRPDLLNTPTGVVDLTTKTLKPHDPTLLMTKITGVGYQAGASHPDWTTALECLPDDVRDWYQVRLGQAVTGHMTPDDLLVVCQGGGENGKSTLNGAAGRALGEYFTLISDRVLLADASAHPTELMELRGARLALIEETPEARRLSVERLKKTVGTPLITARYIRQDSVTFEATHSLFVSTNYRPNVEESDHGTWRRLALLRFPYRYRKPGEALEAATDREGDPTLRHRLLNDDAALRAALAWMVDGAHRWYQEKQIMPPLPDTVAADTRSWRSESDVILAYLGERLVVDSNAHVMSTDLLADFNAWLSERGHRPWSDKTFTARFGEHQEIADQRIEKCRARLDATLSRPPSANVWALPSRPAPQRYRAWLGIRFATSNDIPDEAA